MHYKRIKKDGKILVLSVRKTISISLLWSRYMWLVLIAGLLPVGGGRYRVCVCVCSPLCCCFRVCAGFQVGYPGRVSCSSQFCKIIIVH